MFVVTIILVLIILTASLVSLATPNWSVKNSNSSGKTPAPSPASGDSPKIGLWQQCDKKCSTIDKTTVNSMLNTVRAFAILSALFAFLSLICIFTMSGFQWHSETFLRLFLMLSSMFSLLTLITYAIYRSNLSAAVKSKTQLGYSYYLQIAVLVLTFIATEISFYHPKL